MVVINKDEILKQNFDNKKVREIRCYNGSVDNAMLSRPDGPVEVNSKGQKGRKLISLSSKYNDDSEFYCKIQNAIEDAVQACKKNGIRTIDDLARLNVSHYPQGAEELWDLIRIDITARVLTMADKSGFIATQIINGNFTDPFDPQWLHKYVAPFKPIDGQGQNVPMVFIKTGQKTSIRFTILGVGFQTDLYNEMFNDIFSMQKVNQAVAEGYVLSKNNIVYSPVFNFNYPTAKSVAARTDGETYEENVYYTFRDAIRKLAKLTVFQTGSNVDATSNLSLICHSTRIPDIREFIAGRLTPGSEIRSLRALNEISRIIPYNTEYQYYNNEVIEYQGCDPSKAYLFIPGYYWLAIKRDLTHKVGPGNTFAILSDKEAWYWVPTIYNDQFFGGDKSAKTTTKEPGTTLIQSNGQIVEINLPDEPGTSTST